MYVGLFEDVVVEGQSVQSLVALGAFLKSGDNYILSRYATSMNVVGGHSKVVKYLERNYSYGRLITFADNTFSAGSLYEATGWEKDGLVPPDYSYLVNNKRQHKFGFRKARFSRDPSLLFELNMTESELAALNGLLRIWDAGKVRYVRPHPDSFL